MPSSGLLEGLTVFSENTGLVVGRTLVDSSGWKVPVLVSNQDDRGFTHCAITVFQNGDPDIARDPLSTNRRLADSPGLQMFGTMVVAGPTPDVIYVLIPDSTTSTVDDVSPADLQHGFC